MKGGMGSADAQLAEALEAALLPDTCYRHNSGGEPLAIPQLDHSELVAYHRRNYSGAVGYWSELASLYPESNAARASRERAEGPRDWFIAEP